jgi:hypothetical protein
MCYIVTVLLLAPQSGALGLAAWIDLQHGCYLQFARNVESRLYL